MPSTCMHATKDMQGRYFYNADGELLIVPQSGRLAIATEFTVGSGF
jgi:homogentisate 1,2-dioxygenase